MLLSDISVKRPVFATVLSLLLVALGTMAFLRLPLRELPNIDPPVVSVETNYRGAPAAVVESRITQVLEDAVAGIQGIELIQSSSSNGRSSLTLEFSLDREIESSANDVRDAVSRTVAQLPTEADAPQVAKVDGDADIMIWLNLASTGMDALQLTDYTERFLLDRFATVDGVARVTLAGAQRYAMRIWLKREALAARGLTVSDVSNALRRENVELPAGRIESAERDFTVRIPRSYQSAQDFSELVLAKGADGHLTRLGEVATVELAALEVRTLFRGNGQPQVGLGIIKQSTANALEVSRAVHAEVARLKSELPAQTQMVVAVDTSQFIEASIYEVWFTLSITILLVIAVIYLFLGSWRAALIPAVTVPVCIVASFIFLDFFGFSLNLLTLLALVLSIGLVVDDAIVVLENCQRRIDEEGETPLIAAYRGARQVAFAVIATTLVLVAVFVPIAFMEGNLGRLFRELAVAIASAVAISALVALTLSPMMCSKLLKPTKGHTGLAARVDRLSARATTAYERLLSKWLGRTWAMVVLMLASFAGIYALVLTVPQELAPAEDRGVFFVSLNGPEGAGFAYTLRQMQQVEKRLMQFVDDGRIERINLRAPRGFGGSSSEDFSTGQAVVVMPPWNEREQSTQQVMEQVTKELGELPGVVGFPQMRQGFSRGFGQPLQLVLLGSNYRELASWRDLLIAELSKNPKLQGIDHDFKETRPQLNVQIERSRAADLGVSVEEIATTLDTMLGARRVTTFAMNGEEYEVLLQAQRSDRSENTDLSNLYVRARSGGLVALSSLVTVKERAEAGSFNRFNRLRALTVSARLTPGTTLGEVLGEVEDAVRKVLPAEARYDYKGEAREFKRSGSTIVFTFLLALLVVYLVLAAQFESFLHPVIIMLTVPLAILGALLGLALFGSTLNLYSQIGIVILVGLAAKNGILIVEFANQLRDQGQEVATAILQAASVRLRPIVMTSVATVVGALPLVFAHGAGAQSRFTIGVVILFGVSLSTVLSLFVVPVFYAAIARYTRSPQALEREIARAESEGEPARLHS